MKIAARVNVRKALNLNPWLCEIAADKKFKLKPRKHTASTFLL